MSKAKKCVPPLRFRAETLPHAECGSMRNAKPWETKPLNEWLEVSNAENRGGIFSAEDVLSVSGEFGVVNQIEFQGRSFAGASLAHYRVLKKGQVVYTKSPLKRAPFGIVKANQFQDGIVSSLYGVYDVKDAEPAFVQRYFDAIDRLNNYLCPLVNKGAKNTLLISDEDALAGMVCFPSPPEQRKIGGFFCSLDALIEARAKALEKIESLKKSMLQKMFPHGESLVPEVRFKEFCDDATRQLSAVQINAGGKGEDARPTSVPWERKRLGEIAEYVTEKNIHGQITEVFTNSAENGIVSQLEYFDNAIAKNISAYCIVHENAFVYNPRISVTAPVGPINRNATGRIGVVSPLYTIFRTKGIDVVYLSCFFKTTCWHDFMFLNGDSGARADRFSIKKETLLELPILVPPLPEQQKIGSYFRSLDALIAARREEVGKLKQMKKALLERMFV